MATPSVTDLRAAVIEKAINLEWLIHAVISQHFFGRVRMDFVANLLYDEYCSFALKRRVLVKICPELSGSTEQALNRFNTIRNYFAHVGQSVIEGPDPNGVARVPDPRNFLLSVNFEDLPHEFCELEKRLNQTLFDVFKSKGGQITA
jgi:hypothetical protein